MGQRRIYEFHYPEFSSALRRATIDKTRIEKTDKEAWTAYVKKHNVPEAAMFSRGKSGTMSGDISAVIIDGAGDPDGYYIYCAGESFCLKFESGLE